MNASWFYFGLFCAGGTGVISRYLLTQLTVKLGWTGLPFATLLVNASGSFLMGFLAVYFTAKTNWGPSFQVLVLTGLLGGFTTFSAFSIETIQLLEANQIERALVYVTLSVGLSLLFCFVGLLLARRLF